MIALWIIQLALAIGALALAFALPRPQRPLAAVAGLVPIALGLLATAFGVPPEAPGPAGTTLMAIVIAAVGVVVGSPAATLVLEWAAKGEPVEKGTHGGIMILPTRPERGAEKTEVLRGGAAIGYLERFAVVAAIVVGHLEIAAIVVAIKGLGRFSDLENAQARERFIIGTLASMTWAGLSGWLVVAPTLAG